MSRIRVMHLNDSLDVGGAETMILSLLTELQKHGFEPFMCSMQSGGTLAQSFIGRSIPVIALGKKSGIDLGMIARLARELLRNEVRILHTHNYYAWMYGGLACLMVPGCTHVHTQHSHLVMPKAPPLLVRNLLKDLPKHIIAVSEQVTSSLVDQKYVRPGTDVSVIYNGIDVNRYRARERAAYGTARIGIVARLVGVKNHKLLLEAFSYVIKSGRNAELVIVGDGPLRQSLEEQCNELGIGSKVVFMGERGDIDTILATLDLFVLPSRSEGLSISILEAMASSLPVVASSVGGNPVLVSDHNTGILFEDNNVIALTQSIAALLDDPALRSKLGSSGRIIVTERFSLQTMVGQYMAVYGKCYDF